MNINLYLENKDQTAQFAMNELCFYLNKMDSSSNPAITDNRQEAQIILEVREDLNTSVENAGTDEIIEIIINDGKGSIAGNNVRALLIGVYRFLDEVGVRFLRPGKAYESIPAVNINEITVSLLEKPSFRHRGVCIEGADSIENIIDFIDWLPKVGFNSFFIQFENPYSFLKRWYEHEFNPYAKKEPFTVEIAQKMSDEIDMEIEKRSLLHHRVGHGWTGEVLGYSSKYGWESGVELEEKNKEFAAQLNGKRDLFDGAPILTSLCFANEKVMDRMTDLVTEYAVEHESIDFLHVWLSDARNNICECNDCIKEIPSDQYVRLLNLLDEKLEKAGCQAKICFLLYHELLFAPLEQKINNPDRYVMMFAPITRTFEKSYADVDYENGVKAPKEYVRNKVVMPNSLEENLSYLFAWKKVFKGDSFVYDYPLGRAHYGDFGYVKISKVIYRDVQYLHNLDLNGYISCQELRAGLPNNFPNYVMGKMLWNKNLDYNQLKDEYFTAAYGKDGQIVYNYLETLSEQSSCDYFNAIGSRINPEMYLKYQCIEGVCNEFLGKIKENLINTDDIQRDFYKVLSYHREYCLILAKGLGSLCVGKEAAAQEMWEELLNYIRIHEENYEPYLDVYRVIEVAKNYAGFKLIK